MMTRGGHSRADCSTIWTSTWTKCDITRLREQGAEKGATRVHLHRLREERSHPIAPNGRGWEAELGRAFGGRGQAYRDRSGPVGTRTVDAGTCTCGLKAINVSEYAFKMSSNRVGRFGAVRVITSA